MEDDPDQLDRYVDDLLADRRPERTPLGSEDALEARRVAAMLRAAQPGATLPSREYRDRVEQAIADAVHARGVPAAEGRRPSRRSLLVAGAGSLAAGILATLGVQRLTQRGPEPWSERPLIPQSRGSWQTLMALADVPDSQPVRFTHGPLEGYVIRRGNTVRALSALCTHMPCVLNWSTLRTQFECPCHGAKFAESGAAIGKYGDSTLPPLPPIWVRVQQDQVELFSV
jgi:nitrite reductase/ring-hydroxylating ferredoxin subunit